LDFGVYAEYGAIGVCIALLLGTLAWLRKFVTNLVSNELNEIQDEINKNRDILVKLIDRWNRSDEVRDRRHEDMTKELNNVTDDLNFIKGRVNGRT